MARVGVTSQQAGSTTEAVLVIDAGTSSLRATVLRADGERVATSSVPCRFQYSSEGYVTLDPETLWFDLVRAIHNLEVAVHSVRAVAVASQLGLVLVDDHGAPTMPAFAWADRRAAAEAAELRTSLGDAALAVAGRRVDPEQMAPRLMWVRNHLPDAFQRTRHALSLKDYLLLRLTGVAVTDETNASYTMLFDVRRRRWSNDLLAAAEIDPELLPEPVSATERIGTVICSELGALLGVAVAAGGPDGTLGALGSGGTRRGITVDVAGSSDVLVHTVDRPLSDPEGCAVVNAYALPNLWSIGGPTGLTGGATAWLVGILGYDSVEGAYTDLGRQADAIPAGTDGLAFRTAMLGERFPSWRFDAQGSLIGLKPAHGRAHFIRAAEEGSAFLVREGLAVLRRLGEDVQQVIVVGGVASRPASLQLRADAWNCAVATTATEQGTTLGAALVAGLVGRVYSSVAEAEHALVRFGPQYLPNRSVVEEFDEAYERWKTASAVSVKSPGQ